MATVLILGATGFIGRRVGEALRAANYEVVCGVVGGRCDRCATRAR